MNRIESVNMGEVQGGAPYKVLISIVNGDHKPTNITGGHNLVGLIRTTTGRVATVANGCHKNDPWKEPATLPASA